MIRLDDLEVYKIAMEIGGIIWNTVSKWYPFDKDTLGKQLVRSADSMALNIAEGYGRFSYKENKNFCYYARGSAFETFTSLKKAFDRRLITENELIDFKAKFERFFKLLNPYIKSIGSTQPNDH